MTLGLALLETEIKTAVANKSLKNLLSLYLIFPCSELVSTLLSASSANDFKFEKCYSCNYG